VDSGPEDGRPPEPEASVGITAERRTPHNDELLRALFDRIKGLEAEFEDLIGRRGEGGRPGPIRALKILQEYPNVIRARALEDAHRPGRPEPFAAKLRAQSESVVRATKLIQEWFAAPYSEDVPVALLDAVEQTCELLELGQRHAVIAVGPPTRIETIVTDVRRALYRPEDPPAEEPLGQFALLTIPRHEGSSPRWWPVVLGHEISHLRIRELERADRPASEASNGVPDDLVDSPSSAYFMLHRLGILQDFPFATMREVIEAEVAADRVAPVSPEPPGLTLSREPRDESEDPESRLSVSTLAQRVEIANSWATEIVCDLVMARRFGPSAVAAIGSYLTAIGDFSVISASHPPGHIRIALLTRYLRGVTGPVLGSILAPWLSVRTPGIEEAQPAWVKVINSYLDGKFEAFVTEVSSWPGGGYDATTSEREVAVLLAQRQLTIGLPPFDALLRDFPPGRAETAAPASGDAAVGFESQQRQALDDDVALTEADIINAGWAVVMAAPEDKLFGGKRDIPVDRLVLKALETQQLLSRIRAATPEGEKDESALEPLPEDAGPLTGGAVLGQEAIEARLAEHEIWRRLVITPRLGGTLQSASVDVRLGNRFIIFQRTSTTSFNALKGNNPREVQRSIERAWGSPFVLHPGEVVLASALEYVALPFDLSAQVITRSSYGRLGLITATAAQVHPLYRGCLTLELVNLGTVPLELYPGERVAQLVFMSVQRAESEAKDRLEEALGATYLCPTGPEFPEVKVDPWVKRTRPETVN
jgi:deoxycytidine triphosphate deaminase